MRTHRQLVVYQSILQVLHEPGCPAVADWLRKEAVLCIPHATKLRRQVPLALATRIDTIVQNCREHLKEELDQLRHEPGTDRSGWGALGRVAEFLVSQRGLGV